jgi:hypothetical protein
VGFDLLTLLRKDREGIQCERTFRVIYLLLSGWCRFKDPQNPAEQRDKLQAIPFDKLVMSFARLWDELFRRTGAKLKTKTPDCIPQQEHQQAVTFPVPFPELPGKHGAGRAVVGNGQEAPEFLVTVLYRLRQEDVLPYFDITPPDDAQQTPNDYRTTIEPALSAAADDHLLEDFTPKEREVVNDLKNALKRLTVEQIRALGTHENFKKTASDVEREFKWMQKKVCEIEQQLNAGGSFHGVAQQVLEYTDEACRKSERNRGNYAKARELVLAELNHADTKDAFGDCQESDHEIWERNEMRELAKRARRAHAIARYLERIAYWSTARAQRGPHNNADSALAEVSAELRSAGIRGLPDSLEQVFENNQVFREGMKEKLLALVADLKNP